jgi:hypothetical protein
MSESTDPATPQSSLCTCFLADAQSNLALLQEVFGTQSTRYQRLVEHYRAVADELGCRPAMEQVLASLNPPPQAHHSR